METVGKISPLNDNIEIRVDLTKYIRSETCGKCHQKQYISWRKSWMSHGVKKVTIEKHPEISLSVGGNKRKLFIRKDWEVMHRKFMGGIGESNRGDFRSSCGSCHLTGLDSDSLQFSELGVGCEACHGPGKDHSENKTKHFIPKKSKLCFSCHKNPMSRKRLEQEHLHRRFHR